jgi:uncharacterized membrane protein YhhN
MLTRKRLTIGLFIVLALDLCCVAANSIDFLLPLAAFRPITKSLLMPILMILVWHSFGQMQLPRLVLAALSLSWAGDIFLLFDGMFIPGLVSFLLAHVAYIWYFNTIKPKKTGLLTSKPMFIAPVLVYMLGFLWFVTPHLGEMNIPVKVYSVAIGCMILSSLHTIGRVSKSAGTYFVLGGILFAVSDSLLAVNMFIGTAVATSLLVMLTYGLAQYCIVRGAVLTEISA